MNTQSSTSFSRLSVKDLVEARDLFHVHLINKRNVIATAVGRYLIRKTDLDSGGRFRRGQTRGPRTLANSMVIDISWPCILVFVDRWEEDGDLLSADSNDLVPKTIYMPDGRKVPVCIVEATRYDAADSSVNTALLRFPDNLIGGGFPLLLHSQGVDRLASVGCVVTDGHKFYALTNKHVAGEQGEVVSTRFGGATQRIGASAGLSLGRVPFARLYPEWSGKQLLVNCDAGLIEIDDVHRWKTDIFTLGRFEEVYDLNTFNLDLSLITEHTFDDSQPCARSGKVVGYGAVSGKMEGLILALFYRYKSIGGTEFVSDFLVSGRDGQPLNTHHGDSGTLLLLEDETSDKKPCLRPLALHWGQHEFLGDAGAPQKTRSSYGLATCLSNICRELDVDIVRGWNVGSEYTWGKVGHYTVAAAAIEAVANRDLQDLMKANLENITFANDKINAGLNTKANPDLPKTPSEGLCPLADVPDIIWKQSQKTTDYGRMGDENPNHYADADAPSTGGDAGEPGKTLFQICDSKERLTVEVWSDYYDKIQMEKIGLDPSKPVSKGLICFRVWQIFDYMVDALNSGYAHKFIFAAGVLAHYVGDGCQPLHSSYMSDGDPADNQTVDYTAKRSSSKHQQGDVYTKVVNPGSGVHVAYEDHMIDDKINEIFPLIPGSNAVNEAVDPIDSGQAAGFAVLTLMRKTQDTISPKDIVETYKAAKDNQNVSDALYERFGAATVDCLARGSKYLAAIWDAAWVAGGGSHNLAAAGKVAPQDLVDLYKDRNELPSKHLDTIQPLLR